MTVSGVVVDGEGQDVQYEAGRVPSPVCGGGSRLGSVTGAGRLGSAVRRPAPSRPPSRILKNKAPALGAHASKHATPAQGNWPEGMVCSPRGRTVPSTEKQAK